MLFRSLRDAAGIAVGGGEGKNGATSSSSSSSFRLPAGSFPPRAAAALVATAWNRGAMHARFGRPVAAGRLMRAALCLLPACPAGLAARGAELLGEVQKVENGGGGGGRGGGRKESSAPAAPAAPPLASIQEEGGDTEMPQCEEEQQEEENAAAPAAAAAAAAKEKETETETENGNGDREAAVDDAEVELMVPE